MSISPQVLRELRDALAEQWVTAEEWCRRTGDTLEAVYSRRSKGVWQDGVHSNKPKGGGLWINLLAANQWAAARNASPKASQSGPASAANEASASPSSSAEVNAASP